MDDLMNRNEQQVTLDACRLYFEGAGGSAVCRWTLVRAADSLSAEICGEDGGATSSCAIGER